MKKRTLVEVMSSLINDEVVVIQKDGNTVIREMFIEDGQFFVNELTNTNSEDKYDQRSISDAEAVAYINSIVLK